MADSLSRKAVWYQDTQATLGPENHVKMACPSTMQGRELLPYYPCWGALWSLPLRRLHPYMGRTQLTTRYTSCVSFLLPNGMLFGDSKAQPIRGNSHAIRKQLRLQRQRKICHLQRARARGTRGRRQEAQRSSPPQRGSAAAFCTIGSTACLHTQG